MKRRGKENTSARSLDFGKKLFEIQDRELNVFMH